MIPYMRFVTFCLLCCTVSSLEAQAPGWDRVKRISPGQLIRIGRAHRGITCNFVSADDSSLVCEKRQTILFFPVHHEVLVSRNEVRSVRASRQAISTLVGGAIGVGAGVGIGAAIDSSAKNQVEEGHLATAMFGLLGGVLGMGIGTGTDFLAGPVIYQAP